MDKWQSAYVAGIIDGEGSITLTKLHSSTDRELLLYVQTLTGGLITNKKNYSPDRHKNSYTLSIKQKKDVFFTLENITPFLSVQNGY